MLEELPLNNHHTHFWAQDLLNIYSQATNFTLSALQTLDLFRLVEKFPSKVTMQLL